VFAVVDIQDLELNSARALSCSRRDVVRTIRNAWLVMTGKAAQNPTPPAKVQTRMAEVIVKSVSKEQ
jgi:hypothetical protein